MRDVHLLLVLSPREFNDKTSLVIGVPMTTAQYNADNPFVVADGLASGRRAGEISHVLWPPTEIVRLAATRSQAASNGNTADRDF